MNESHVENLHIISSESIYDDVDISTAGMSDAQIFKQQ
jgi:hypothetical protein